MFTINLSVISVPIARKIRCAVFLMETTIVQKISAPNMVLNVSKFTEYRNSDFHGTTTIRSLKSSSIMYSCTPWLAPHEVSAQQGLKEG